MRRPAISIVLLALFLLPTTALRAQWQQVVPGIDYQNFSLTSPRINNVFVTRMDRTSTYTIIDASLANGKIAQPGVAYNVETIPNQAARYNGAFGNWGRETARYRYKVVAAVNGCGFSTANGCPDSAMIMGGAFIKRTFGSTAAEMGGMGFTYKLGSAAPSPGTPHMAFDIYLPASAWKDNISFTDGSYLQYTRINDQPRADSIILYTHHYGLATPATTGVTEYVVQTENLQPLRIIPWSNYVRGTVVDIKTNSGGGTVIPFDCIVIVVSGSLIDDVAAKIPAVGTEVRFSTEIHEVNSTTDWPASPIVDWTNMYTAIGPMWGVILRDGVKSSSTSTGYISDIHPRTAVAFNAQYIYFVVVDGRNPGVSEGMTLSELADWCISALGATDAVNNDGGGSSIMWVDGLVKNNPSDGSPRAVANGLMMIQLQPKEVSAAFTPGQTVYTYTPLSTLSLRTGPGTNFPVIQSLPTNTALTVVAHSLDGLRAQDVAGAPGYWWKVRTATNVEGWASEYYLSAVSRVPDWPRY